MAPEQNILPDDHEALGYVLSPSKPPIISVALLEDTAGDVNIGDVLAIPVVLDDKSIYILGNVLSISVSRPLLDENSRAPYALARGDTMNLFEDVDMLTPSELEELSYIAKVYVHTVYYENKIYPAHVVIPGSKVIKPPSDVLKAFASLGDIKLGTVRGYDINLSISEDHIFRHNMLIMGLPESRFEFMNKIIKNVKADLKLYIGREDIGRDKLPESEEELSKGEYVVDRVKNFIKIAEVIERKALVIIDNAITYSGTFRSITAPVFRKKNIATILLTDPTVQDLPFKVFRRFVSCFVILGAFDRFEYPLKENHNLPRIEILPNLADDELFVLGNPFMIPIVGLIS